MTVVTNASIQLSETVEIPWNRLRKSQDNVRVVAPHNAEDEALVANIGETGVILENLIVAPIEGEEGAYAVHAGGRRWSAIGVNVEKGVLPETFPVPCRIQTGGSLTAVSLAENLQAPMHPADEFEAFKRIQEQGLSIEDIALHFGLPPQRVTQRLKLAGVAKRILSAYRKDDIDLKTVMAFTLASSQKQQLAVYRELEGRCHAHSVKQALTGNAIASDDRLVRYIGLEAYKAADGTLVNDLFAEHDHLPDRELVERLAQEKLEAAAVRLTKKEGWQTVQVTTERYFQTYDYHRIEPEPVGAPEELTERIATLTKEYDYLQETYTEWTDKEEERETELVEALELAEREVDAYREYSDEQKAQALCFITISETGKTVISRGYISRAARRKAEAAAACAEGEGEPARGIPQALITDLGIHRQQVAKVALLNDPAVASDLLLYTLCHDILGNRHEGRAVEMRTDEVRPQGEAFADSKATASLDKPHSKLPTEWMAIESPTERFAALRKLSPKRKQALQAYCVSAAFMASLDVEGRDTLTEAVLVDLQVDYAALWRPTGEGYFKRLTVPMLFDLGTELFGEEWRNFHSGDKKRALVEWFDHFFVGPAPKDLSDEHRAIRNEWLPEGFVRE